MGAAVALKGPEIQRSFGIEFRRMRIKRICGNVTDVLGRIFADGVSGSKTIVLAR